MMRDNSKIISEYFIKDCLDGFKLEDVKLNISVIKGHATTNVYKVEIRTTENDVARVFYIKESSDTSNDMFNKYIEDEYNNTAYINQLFSFSESYEVVKPVVYYKKFNAFITEEIEGIRLDKAIVKLVLLRKNKELEYLLGLCEKWLKSFQKIPPQICTDGFDILALERKKISFLKDSVLKNSPVEYQLEHEDVFVKLFNCLEALELSDIDVAIKHNDFAPWNILLSGKKIIVFDFADIAVDYRYYDLFYFVHSLNKVIKKIPFSSSVSALMKKTMLKNTKVSDDVERYYTSFFYIQDMELYLRRSNEGGAMAVYYMYLYKKSLFNLKKIIY